MNQSESPPPAVKPKRSLLKRIAIWAGIAFLVSIPLGYGFMSYSTTPQFCASCHNMVPYVNSWEISGHGKAGVTCVQCHFEPGLAGTLDGKFKASTQLVKYVTSTEGSKPWAQVSDASCTQSGCHGAGTLTKKVDFKIGRVSIPFDHTVHLAPMSHDKQLRCTSCHSQVVQGQHMTITPSACIVCHVKGAAENPKLGECTTCHSPPEHPITAEPAHEFRHLDFVGRGVKCEMCHSDVTSGTGEVPKYRCYACHAIQADIDRYGDPELLHREHVTRNKTDCIECHTHMPHQLRAPSRVAAGGCGQCHDKGHGLAESFYRGEGGRAVPATPNPMFQTRVGCSGCHAELGAPHSEAAVKGNAAACVACHGPGYDGVLDRWRDAFGPAAEAVAAEVTEASAASETAGASDLRTRLEDAKHDAVLVVKDGSRGVHNPWFARKLLETAFATSQAAWAQLDPSREKKTFPLAPKFATQQQCALVCHVGIETRKIGVEGTRFDHTTHVMKSGRDCDACHSVEQHKVTLPAAKDCAACHHAPGESGKRECASCHKEADAFLRGVLPGGEQGPQMMAKITCVECHGEQPVGGRDARRADVQKRCDVCHKEKYAKTVAEWTSDSDEWLAEADARMAKIAARLAAGQTTEAKAAAARELLERLRRGVPAHNVLLAEDVKDAFDAAASAAEK